MRIPSFTQFRRQIESLNRQSESIMNIRTRINSGKKLINSSDDPILAQSINRSKDYLDLLNSYKNNLNMAQTRISLQDSTMTACSSELVRASELIKSAQNDTLSDADRRSIATELQGIMKNMANLANTRDGSREYIFSGTSVNTLPYSMVGSSYQYGGSLDSSSVNIGQSASIIYGESGQRIFGDIKTGNGVFTISQGSTPNTGTAEAAVGYVTSNASYVPDTYTMSFVTNSAGQLAYQIVGAASGQVIPVPPQTSPADAPQYVAGQTVTFNGVNFVMNGNPALTDQFVIAPSTKQNALETINQVVAELNKSIVTPADRAAFHQAMGELSESVKGISKHITNVQSEIGYRGKEVEDLTLANATEIKDQTLALGNFENADTYQLISDLAAEGTALEMNQKLYAKIQEFFTQLLQTTFQ